MMQWLATVLPDAEAPQSASSDASFRRYFRTHCQKQSHIVMDAPPEHEDCQPFVHVADWMQALQLPGPRVRERDLRQGFLLLSDLGQQTLLDHIQAAHYPPLKAAELALEELKHWHLADQRQPLSVPNYADDMLRRELELFPEWYVRQACKAPWSAEDQRGWERLCTWLIEHIQSHPTTLVHRDFHSRNLMPQDDGRLAIIDFQDAVRGSLCYDLISITRDCYWDLSGADYAQCLRQYHAFASASGLLSEDWPFTRFAMACDLMALQRHLKVAGIFVRLYLRDGKAGYLQDIPRTMQYVRQVCRRHATHSAVAWLHQSLPLWTPRLSL
nr:phosphotransferase [Oceanococcus sp. HetDA_MAG_MS8]